MEFAIYRDQPGQQTAVYIPGPHSAAPLHVTPRSETADSDSTSSSPEFPAREPCRADNGACRALLLSHNTDFHPTCYLLLCPPECLSRWAVLPRRVAMFPIRLLWPRIFGRRIIGVPMRSSTIRTRKSLALSAA